MSTVVSLAEATIALVVALLLSTLLQAAVARHFVYMFTDDPRRATWLRAIGHAIPVSACLFVTRVLDASPAVVLIAPSVVAAIGALAIFRVGLFVALTTTVLSWLAVLGGSVLLENLIAVTFEAIGPFGTFFGVAVVLLTAVLFHDWRRRANDRLLQLPDEAVG
ncbi:MAG: hypothetical protein NZ898_00785 [Myxococcota bacterium]|nr:hypothetical protein [Myxococcota bacterium]MDW8362683.1 hypothetical protein [Myxococcales bacterium]